MTAAERRGGTGTSVAPARRSDYPALRLVANYYLFLVRALICLTSRATQQLPQRLGSRHADANTQLGSRLAYLHDPSGKQIFRFYQRELGSAASDGHGHAKPTGGRTIIDSAADNSAIGVNRAVLTTRPTITAAEHIALSGLEHAV